MTVTGITAALLTMMQPCDAGIWTTKYDTDIDRAVNRYWPLHYHPLKCRWKAQLIAESGLNPDAVSPTGAVQVAQIMPATFRDIAHKAGLRCSIHDTKCSIQAGTWYLRTLLDDWTWHRPLVERHRLAAASYNAGLGNILTAQKKCHGAVLWADVKRCLPSVTGGEHSTETITYVDRIDTIYSRLRGADE